MVDFRCKYSTAFQRLRTNNQILGGYNYVARNPNVYTADSHGTLVLSTMGGYKENSLVLRQMLLIIYLLQKMLPQKILLKNHFGLKQQKEQIV
jgi:hypothetical protein